MQEKETEIILVINEGEKAKTEKVPVVEKTTVRLFEVTTEEVKVEEENEVV